MKNAINIAVAIIFLVSCAVLAYVIIDINRSHRRSSHSTLKLHNQLKPPFIKQSSNDLFLIDHTWTLHKEFSPVRHNVDQFLTESLARFNKTNARNFRKTPTNGQKKLIYPKQNRRANKPPTETKHAGMKTPSNR